VFRAIGKLFKSFWYLVTGRVDAASDDMRKNPHVIQATYDNIVREKTQRIHQYKDAVAAMIAQEEKKRARLAQLTEEVGRLEQLKTGAAAKAKSVVDKLKASGATMEQIKTNEDYMKCLAAFNDFSTSLKEKEAHINELEEDIQEINQSIAEHKVQLQNLLREIDKLKEEASATVADMITAREEEEINNILAGVSEEAHSRELQEMREMRQQQKARAKIAREMAGTDTKMLEHEFMEYARTTTAASEFDRLIGLAEEADTEPAAEAPAKSRLPES